jgi:hypothetical protein
MVTEAVFKLEHKQRSLDLVSLHSPALPDHCAFSFQTVYGFFVCCQRPVSASTHSVGPPFHPWICAFLASYFQRSLVIDHHPVLVDLGTICLALPPVPLPTWLGS